MKTGAKKVIKKIFIQFMSPEKTSATFSEDISNNFIRDPSSGEQHLQSSTHHFVAAHL
jgi:hypothetical protein